MKNIEVKASFGLIKRIHEHSWWQYKKTVYSDSNNILTGRLIYYGNLYFQSVNYYNLQGQD